MKQWRNPQGMAPQPENLKDAIEVRIAIWIIMFRVSQVSLGGDLDVLITDESIFSNPDHTLTRFLLYVYSLESFIPGEMKRVQL